jgi:hypothetical protein
MDFSKPAGLSTESIDVAGGVTNCSGCQPMSCALRIVIAANLAEAA